MRAIAAYRRTGAELPYGDLRRSRGTPFEGWFWRFTDPVARRVLIAYCGLSRDGARSPWGTVGVASHPSAVAATRLIDDASATADGLGLRGSGDDASFAAGPRRVSIAIDRRTALEVEIDTLVPWPARAFGACGPVQLVPGLSQLWHPDLLHGRAHGTALLAGATLPIDGWHAYAERNWGPAGFPPRWWWGQAHGFGDPEACVAFAGGPVRWGPLGAHGTALVIALGGEVIRLVAPAAAVRTQVGAGGWRIDATSARYRVSVAGQANGSAPHSLPVPVPRERRHREAAATHHLTGRIDLTVHRGRRTWFRGSSDLAGLETGDL